MAGFGGGPWHNVTSILLLAAGGFRNSAWWGIDKDSHIFVARDHAPTWEGVTAADDCYGSLVFAPVADGCYFPSRKRSSNTGPTVVRKCDQSGALVREISAQKDLRFYSIAVAEPHVVLGTSDGVLVADGDEFKTDPVLPPCTGSH